MYFSSIDGAVRARDHLTQQPKWKGNIAFAKKEKKDCAKASISLVVANIDFKITSVAELRGILSKFGTIFRMSIRADQGVVFVSYNDGKSAERACEELNGQRVNGRVVHAELSGGKAGEMRKVGKPSYLSKVIIRAFSGLSEIGTIMGRCDARC